MIKRIFLYLIKKTFGIVDASQLVASVQRLAEATGQNRMSGGGDDLLVKTAPASKIAQISLAQQYREHAARLEKEGRLDLLAEFDDVEFRVFSQNGEDGILHYIFSLIGTTNKTLVEMCAGDGAENNTTNLILNHGWNALLFEGNPFLVKKGAAFFAKHPDSRIWPPKYVEAWITRENVNQIISGNGVEGEIDLFSLDLDGNDYWIWKALTVIEPRVVILEYQDILGPDRSVTIPYDPKFQAEFGPHGPDYCGASLAAFVKLGKEKGYRLVGCQRYGYNAFFMKNGVGEKYFPEIDHRLCFRHPKVKFGMEHRYPNSKDRPWESV